MKLNKGEGKVREELSVRGEKKGRRKEKLESRLVFPLVQGRETTLRGKVRGKEDNEGR